MATNAAGVQQLADGGSSGTLLGRSGDSIATYGATPVAQAAAIVAVTGTVSLTTTINAILTAIRNLGVIAA